GPAEAGGRASARRDEEVARRSQGGAATRRARRAGSRHDARGIRRLRRRAGEGLVPAGQGLGRQAQLGRDRTRVPGISIHVVDVSRGMVAAGMKLELYGPQRNVVASGMTNAKGLLEVDSTVAAGAYEAIFHVAA